MRRLTGIVGCLIFGYYLGATLVRWAIPPHGCTPMTTTSYLTALTVFSFGAFLAVQQIRR